MLRNCASSSIAELGREKGRGLQGNSAAPFLTNFGEDRPGDCGLAGRSNEMGSDSKTFRARKRSGSANSMRWSNVVAAPPCFSIGDKRRFARPRRCRRDWAAAEDVPFVEMRVRIDEARGRTMPPSRSKRGRPSAAACASRRCGRCRSRCRRVRGRRRRPSIARDRQRGTPARGHWRGGTR